MSRQKRSLPWDLLEAALLSLLAIALTLLPKGVVEFTSPLAIILVIFLPGYAAILALFPRASDLAIKGRMLLSMGANVIIAVLTGLCLGVIGGIRSSTFAQALAIISLTLIIAAYIRWTSLPSGWRFVPSFVGDMLPPGRRQSNNDHRRMIVVLISLGAIIVVSAFGYASHANSAVLTVASTPAESGEKKFTEFYILDESSQSPIEAGSRSTIMAGIINREHRTVDYTLRLVINGSVLSEKSIKLNHNKSWEGPLSYTIGSPVDMQKLDLLLYKDDDFKKPYDERTIWINVTGQKAEQVDVKSESNSAAKSEDLSGNGGVEPQMSSNSMSGAVDSQNQEVSSIEENRPTEEEVQSMETKSTENTPQLSGQNELQQTAAPENLSESPAIGNSSSKPSKMNTSRGDIVLNYSSGIETMNASDIYQESYEDNGKIGSQEGRENSSADMSPMNNSNNKFNRSYNNVSSGSKVDYLEASPQSSKNLSSNVSKISPASTVQKFYTRPRPGSSNSQGSAISNSLYKNQLTGSAFGTEKPGYSGNQQIASEIVSNRSNGGTIQNGLLSQQASNNINMPNSALNNPPSSNAAKVNSAGTNVNNQANKSANKSANISKNITLKTQESKAEAPQDEEAIRMAEMAKKIESWVSTRGLKPSNSSTSYKSDIIQFNSANNSVVLGGQSSKTKKIG